MARKNGVKRLLMYVIVIVGSLFVGMLAYYFARNEETIALEIKQGEIVYLNSGNTQLLPLKHVKPSKFTKITVSSSNENVVSYQSQTKTLNAKSGGVSTITITTTNEDFGPFKFDVFVGDGSVDNPWYISTARQFAKIGSGYQDLTGENFKPTDAYELIGDIDLGNLYSENYFWTPILNFDGNIQGEGHSVLNLKINSNNIPNVGLFGELGEKAVIENINFINANVTAHNASTVGIIAGINKGFIGKVKVMGSITSSSDDAIVGGVVGSNRYVTSRPAFNMVEARISFATRSLTGGLIGENRSGIVFNSSIIITDLKVYDPSESATTGVGLYASTYDTVANNFAFGGIVGKNLAGNYGEDTQYLRQTANKNVFVKFGSISAPSLYDQKIALVAYQNTNGDLSNLYYIANNYTNIIILNNVNASLTELGNAQNIATKTNIKKHTNQSFNDLASAQDETGLSDIWKLDRVARELTLDFEASYENPQVSNPGKEIDSKQGVIDAINNIYTTETPISYVINIDKIDETEEINGENVLVIYGHEITGEIIDTNWTNWIPLNSKGKSYTGEIIVNNGRLIIKNLIIETPVNINQIDYYGFISKIAGANTIIKNIGLENVRIFANFGKQLQYAGGIAGGIENGYVENVTVDGIEIKDADVAGFAFGAVTGGTIKNVVVGNFARLEEELVNASEEDEYSYNNPPNQIISGAEYVNNVNFGGFAGKVDTSVEDITVHYGLIKHQGKDEARIGGFAGTQSKSVKIKDIRINYGLLIQNTQVGKGYHGGVTGYVVEEAIIEYAFSLANINVIITHEDENHAGGIAGYLATGAVIRHSFAGDQSSGEIYAKNVGGIVSVNNGSVYQSYATGIYKGHNVGGVAYVNFGTIESVLITAKLEGVGTSSKYSVAGIAVYMPQGSTAKYIISTSSISGDGETQLFAETNSKVKYSGAEIFIDGVFSGKIFNGTHKVGSLENYLVINYGSALRQKGSFGNLSFWVKLVETDEDGLKLQGGKNPYSEAGFTDLNGFIWKFESGQMPRLLNIATNPFMIVEEV